jgi:undecaprenyl-diphosphatase
MRSDQLKRARIKARLKNAFIWLQTLAGSILFLGLATAAGALFLFAWLAEEVLEGDTQAFDETIRASVHGFAGGWLTAFMNFVTMLGSTLFLGVVFICILIIFIGKNWKRSAVLLAVTMVGAIILNFVLKVSFARARPMPFFDTPLPDSYSFPSGHALYAACFYGVLAWLVAARMRDRSLKILIWALAVVIALLIGLSRIYLGVHYPSDVIAGYAAAIVWVFTVIWADLLLQKKNGFFKKQAIKQ